MAQPFFALRVEITTLAHRGDNMYEKPAQMYVRDYERGNMRMGRDKFGCYAIGDLITLLGFHYMGIPFSVSTTEIDVDGNPVDLDYEVIEAYETVEVN